MIKLKPLYSVFYLLPTLGCWCDDDSDNRFVLCIAFFDWSIELTLPWGMQ